MLWRIVLHFQKQLLRVWKDDFADVLNYTAREEALGPVNVL